MLKTLNFQEFPVLTVNICLLASLIKTIIGGAQIIDLMILVVDITKGIQTQTAECLVIGEITCSRMIVVLNKIDSIPADKRDKTIEKVTWYNIATRYIFGKIFWRSEGEWFNILEFLDDQKNENYFISNGI